MKYPVIILVISFILGILIEELIIPNFYFYLILIPIITFLYFLLQRKFTQFTQFKSIHLIFTLLIFLFGALYLNWEHDNRVSYPFDSPKIRNAEIIGKICKIDLIKNQKLSFTLELEKINNKKFESELSHRFVCNFYKDSTISIDSIYNIIAIGNFVKFVGVINKARDQRNPGEFNYQQYLYNKNLSGIINCYRPETFEIIDNHVEVTDNFVFLVRKALDEKISLLHNSKSSALLKGILLADRSEIDYDIKTSFIDSGVIHVLAVSGLHVGFISIIIFLLLGRLDIRVKYIGTIFGLILFLILTGGHPSVFRATIMASVYLLAKLTNRVTNGFNSIAIAALIILLINPNELFNPGFLLSFSAVLSILIIYPKLSKAINQLNINKVIKNVLLFISVSFAAQIGTLPFTIIYFNKLSIISILANLIVIPIIGLNVSIGILTLAISLLSNYLAGIFASANSFLIDFLYYFVNKISQLDFSYIAIYNFSTLDGIIYYAFISLIFYLSILGINRKTYYVVIPLLVISLGNFITLDDKKLLPDRKLSIMAVDVGQGDSFLIKFPNSKIALIDAGNYTEYFDTGDRIIFPLLKRLGINRIDYAFISHLDTDHFGGIISLINYGIINKLYLPLQDSSIKSVIFEEFLQENNVPYNYYSDNYFEEGNCKVYLLCDTTSQEYLNFDSNNKSGIIKIVHGKNSFLFVGDAEHEAENFLIKRYRNFLESDVLKVGHHGSKTSTSNNFLETVNPKYGIISAGIMNRFNHPSDEVIKKLDKNNIEIFRTDKDGAIILISDGKEIKSLNWKEL
ncbi:MAG: DNA internalization-related competence protein ComEC/Rec2 [Ignavibacteriales bacterium]|nr:DNA internalization-related competence protein ComEC/Rec2 [Ignavibacteriales bacterium]